MSKHFLIFAFCVSCDKTRDLKTNGRCSHCDSDAIVVRSKHASPEPSVIEGLMELEEMFRRTD